jgi:uncharacterized membrane protein YfcA
VDVLNVILIFFVGLLTGFLNVMAGGGSMLTLPLLTFLGLSIDVANGTNRVSILIQNLAATYSFKKNKVHILKRSLILSIPATLGAICGTLVVVQINESLLKKIAAVLILLMGAFIVLKKDVWKKNQIATKKNNILSYLTFFFIGFYGGFLQAGVGFFFISALMFLEGFDIVKTNAAKVAIIAVYTIASLIIFAAHNQVDWKIGFVLAIGSAIGSSFGARYMVLNEIVWVKYLLFAAILFAALKMFFS